MSESQENIRHYEFKAEIKQLLNILVHSLYTHKEIFLRELISNASDALDKIRFETTKGTVAANPELPLEIKISADKDKKILTITDTGIGMTEQEIITNIGTIAKSGSADFIAKLKEANEAPGNIIGKFGVGFYSVFMVANKVTIRSRSFNASEKACEWSSDGLGSYELKTLDEEIARGTSVIIELKDEETEFLEKYRLESVIKKHSNFINFPILIEGEQANKVSALWREPKSSVSKEQYDEFYKFLTYDDQEPLETIHKSVDAPIQFNCLLFIPPKNTDIFGYNRDNYGLDLYVRRVLIQHQNKELLPEYLSFVKGVVDSEDIPLNISRETLQENIIFHKISQSVTTQILSSLDKMASGEKEKYSAFWKEHGRIFKLGYADYANQEKYMNLLRFNSSSSKDENELISLQDYVSKMKPEQKEIFFILGANRENVESNPHLEIFRSKGLEVLYLFDPLDEFALSSLRKFKDFEFISVDLADLSKIDKYDNVTSKDNKAEELSQDDEKAFAELMAKIKAILGERVTDVKISKRLQESPACLVNPDDTMSSSMQKIMKIVGKDTSIPKKVLEINKDHNLFRNMLKAFKNNREDTFIRDVIEQLFESALLLEGYLVDPHKLVNRMNNYLNNSSNWYISSNKSE